MSNENYIKEYDAIIRRWGTGLMRGLSASVFKMRVKDTGAMRSSLKHRIGVKGKTIEYQVEFLPRGRFVDMGVRMGEPIGVRPKNKIKRWYSRILYGRIHALYGALGFKLIEQGAKPLREMVKF